MGVGIEVTNLNAWYGTNHTLQDINLNIPANHATALIGPSGCGKSTFVRCLNRMHETNPIARVTGTVRIGELDIYNDCKPVEIRRRVGMVFQRPNPFPTMSIYDNVLAGYLLVHFFEHTITPHFHYGEETHADEYVHSHRRVSVLFGLMIHTFFDGIAITAGVLTLVVLIFSEVAPKTLAARHPERLAFGASWIIVPLMRLSIASSAGLLLFFPFT